MTEHQPSADHHRIELERPTSSEPVGSPVTRPRRRWIGNHVEIVVDTDAPRTPGVVNS